MQAFITSFLFVALAEMGDKTQLLAMAFAAEYKAYKVLIAVFLATILNHALAVALGRLLSTTVPFDVISLVAALSFVLFGLWTVRGDTLDKKDKRESRFGPIITVMIAFFLAELGDKTQLTTISLAIEYMDPVQVLIGTTLGMVVSDGIGILAGALLARFISQKTIKFVSAGIFILFGLSEIFGFLAHKINPLTAGFIVLALLIATAYAAHVIATRGKSLHPDSAVKEQETCHAFKKEDSAPKA
ncbi:MAG: TMEM165/GDT1 family protein [Endomicrobiales bacterium]